MAVDLSGVGCVAIGYNNDTNQRIYTNVAPWSADCYDQVLMQHGDFRAILQAAQGASSPSDPPAPAASQFSSAEVAALKAQVAAGQLTIQVESKPLDPDYFTDRAILFGLFLAALIAVFCGRRLLDLFTSPHRD